MLERLNVLFENGEQQKLPYSAVRLTDLVKEIGVDNALGGFASTEGEVVTEGGSKSVFFKNKHSLGITFPINLVPNILLKGERVGEEGEQLGIEEVELTNPAILERSDSTGRKGFLIISPSESTVKDFDFFRTFTVGFLSGGRVSIYTANMANKPVGLIERQARRVVDTLDALSRSSASSAGISDTNRSVEVTLLSLSEQRFRRAPAKYIV